MRLIATRYGITTAPPAPAAARRSWLKRLAAGLGAALLARPAAAGPTKINGDSPYVGEIMLFAGTYEPQGWLFCDGRSLDINTYSALYALIGTTYGGDGQTNFNLPDLRGRVPRHVGASPSTAVGLAGGNSQVTLTANQVPAHNHALNSAATAASTSPVSTLPAPATATDVNGEAVAVNLYAASANNQAAGNEISNTGNSQPVPLTPATVAVNYCIATDEIGIYPSQQ